ncbi:radical SAM family heme chaperone HemW [Devriesea agamarum]|uniref:radical SAM family heme chaperone HemW n=1 Tax=Devriesea agamarum TaxID=472569 RepID=UPI0038B30A1C
MSGKVPSVAVGPGAGAGVAGVTTGLSVYIHVPFCAVRCGYCDFNTYTAKDLGGGGSRAEYADHACREMDLVHADDQQHGYEYSQVDTVFFGGGTPTLLPASDLVQMLDHLRTLIPLAPDAEVSIEANPDSVTADTLRELADGGVTRVSFGMQSAVPRVLATLDRTHDPARIPRVVQWARDVGLQVSLDLIYGTPGERIEDVETSVRAALACEPDHVSAYSLIIEGNTAMARQLRRGEITPVDSDLMADEYDLIDALLAEAGYTWYEVSNWSQSRQTRCRHNLAYWHGADWWGIGPGAHRHRDGMRAWNLKHPSRYAHAVTRGVLPQDGQEILTAEDRRVERIMLELRTVDGLDIDAVAAERRSALHVHANRGLLDPAQLAQGKAVLTPAGRLLADQVIRDLT